MPSFLLDSDGFCGRVVITNQEHEPSGGRKIEVPRQRIARQERERLAVEAERRQVTSTLSVSMGFGQFKLAVSR